MVPRPDLPFGPVGSTVYKLSEWARLVAFAHAYGREVNEAKGWLARYRHERHVAAAATSAGAPAQAAAAVARGEVALHQARGPVLVADDVMVMS